MYRKMFLNDFLSMMPPYDVFLMYSKVVELEESYFAAEDHFKIHWVSFEKI